MKKKSFVIQFPHRFFLIINNCFGYFRAKNVTSQMWRFGAFYVFNDATWTYLSFWLLVRHLKTRHFTTNDWCVVVCETFQQKHAKTDEHSNECFSKSDTENVRSDKNMFFECLSLWKRALDLAESEFYISVQASCWKVKQIKSDKFDQSGIFSLLIKWRQESALKTLRNDLRFGLWLCWMNNIQNLIWEDLYFLLCFHSVSFI